MRECVALCVVPELYASFDVLSFDDGVQKTMYDIVYHILVLYHK